MISGLTKGSESVKPRTVGESLKPQVKPNHPLKLLCQVFYCSRIYIYVFNIHYTLPLQEAAHSD